MISSKHGAENQNRKKFLKNTRRLGMIWDKVFVADKESSFCILMVSFWYQESIIELPSLLAASGIVV